MFTFIDPGETNEKDPTFRHAWLLLALALPFPASAHGGGCRKDSPPGKCCHMDRKAGTVHCH
ncbi:hypothetical protein CYO81_16020 [Bordetella pertussis]|uniref:hypothetical protein n=1 Tax=Bordetella pertussis TaxID=520 RepID=UPI000FDCC522|nr:hypothetical protein [Bordetella pertussis]AZY82380.1 hypothetical protein CYO81_16020 [Bordetella pertussis]